MQLSNYLYKIYYCLFLFCLANITIIATASISIPKQEKLTNADIYKQSIHDILKDYSFFKESTATATYNHNNIIGSSKKPLTLTRANDIKKSSDIVISPAYTKPILKVIEDNTRTKFFITGILRSDTAKYQYAGELTYKLNTDIVNLINNATSTSNYSHLVNDINNDIYRLSEIIYLTHNNSEAFDQLADYADLFEIVNDINTQVEDIVNMPMKSVLLQNFLSNDIGIILPKIKRFDQIYSAEEYAKKIIDILEENINYKLKIDPNNIYQSTKKLLLYISNIQKAIEQNSNISDITNYMAPNTYVSTYDNTMNVIEMVDNNIKKRLLHIQNIYKNIVANNMWFQPGYLYSTGKNADVMGEYNSKVKGVSIGAEDSNSAYNLSLGFCYSYAKAITQSNKINTVSIETDNYIFSSYISFIFNKFIFDLQFNYIKAENNKQRIDILGYKYLSNYNSHAISVELSTGKKFQLENDMIISCKVLCNILQNNTLFHKEVSDYLDYQIFPYTNNKVSLGAEATIYGGVYIGKVRINPECFVNIKYNLAKNNKTHDVSLYDYKSRVEVLDKNKLNIKIGIGILSNIYSVNVRLDYAFKTSSNFKTHMINGNLSYYF